MHVGTHKYTVEEVCVSKFSWNMTPTKAEVTITVTKEGHNLQINTFPSDYRVQQHIYTCNTSTIPLHKTFEGKTLEAMPSPS